jgi:arylsulfatase A-like enzyme
MSNAFSYVTDIMPTLLDLAGIKHPREFKGKKVEPMRGRSMARVLSGSSNLLHEADAYIGGEMGGGMWMRQGSYKAVSVAKPYPANLIGRRRLVLQTRESY